MSDPPFIITGTVHWVDYRRGVALCLMDMPGDDVPRGLHIPLIEFGVVEPQPGMMIGLLRPSEWINGHKIRQMIQTPGEMVVKEFNEFVKRIWP
jgi:hypothetical protein